MVGRAIAGLVLLFASGPTRAATDSSAVAVPGGSLRGAAPPPAVATSEPTADVRVPATGVENGSPTATSGTDGGVKAPALTRADVHAPVAAGEREAPALAADAADSAAGTGIKAPAPAAESEAPASERTEHAGEGAGGSAPAAVPPKVENKPCLCVFDIDRTLTGQQGLAFPRCPGNEVERGVWDDAYGGGDLTLSSLGKRGVMNTVCGACHLGIVSHGTAGGEDMKNDIRDVLGGLPGDWSLYSDIHSPLVIGCENKPPCVQAVMEWYNEQGAGLAPENVYLFDDKTQNINSFWGTGFNAIQVSCASRAAGEIGLCGGAPREIRLERGVHTCR